MVLGNMSALPPFKSKYWTTTEAPHMVSIDVDEVSYLDEEPTPGWQLFTQRFRHSQWGGGTDAEAILAVLAPHAKVTLHPLDTAPPVQTWRPCSESLDPLVPASPAKAEDKPASKVAKVYWRGADVLPWGLFPSAHATSVVRVPCVFNLPTRWGRRLLTGFELAALWDAPDTFKEWARQTNNEFVLALLASSTPGKILTYGGDFLYSSCIGGGGGGGCAPDGTSDRENAPSGRRRGRGCAPDTTSAR